MNNRAFDEVQAMIDDCYGLDSPESIAVKEAFRVYLAWLDAPEGDAEKHPVDSHELCVTGIVPLLIFDGVRRIKIVEVK